MAEIAEILNDVALEQLFAQGVDHLKCRFAADDSSIQRSQRIRKTQFFKLIIAGQVLLSEYHPMDICTAQEDLKNLTLLQLLHVFSGCTISNSSAHNAHQTFLLEARSHLTERAFLYFLENSAVMRKDVFARKEKKKFGSEIITHVGLWCYLKTNRKSIPANIYWRIVVRPECSRSDNGRPAKGRSQSCLPFPKHKTLQKILVLFFSCESLQLKAAIPEDSVILQLKEQRLTPWALLTGPRNPELHVTQISTEEAEKELEECFTTNWASCVAELREKVGDMANQARPAMKKLLEDDQKRKTENDENSHNNQATLLKSKTETPATLNCIIRQIENETTNAENKNVNLSKTLLESHKTFGIKTSKPSQQKLKPEKLKRPPELLKVDKVNTPPKIPTAVDFRSATQSFLLKTRTKEPKRIIKPKTPVPPTKATAKSSDPSSKVQIKHSHNNVARLTKQFGG